MNPENLPDRPPDRIWGGPGTGARCAICNAAVHDGEVELEIEYVLHDRPRPKTFQVHLRCFSKLESEGRFVPRASAPAVVKVSRPGA